MFRVNSQTSARLDYATGSSPPAMAAYAATARPWKAGR